MLRIRTPFIFLPTTVNAANLQLKLLEKTTSSQATCDTSLSLLMAAKSFKEMKLQKISSAPTFYDLPSPSASLVGQIYYINNERTFYTVEIEIGNYIWRKLTGFTNSIFSWGSNSSGELGQNNVTSRSSPTTIAGANSAWCNMSAGNVVSAAIQTNGTLWTWGINAYGQLGTNDTVNKSSPVTVSGGGNNWKQVSVSSYCANFMSAVKSDGTLWTWGRNTYGQLGTNTNTSRSSPGTVAGGGTNWCFVSSGDRFAAAIKNDGTLWTWGRNQFGNLGDNSTTNQSSPVTTIGGGTNWCAVGVGFFVSGAIKNDGTLWTWGIGIKGVLGSNNTNDRSSPNTTIGGGSTWCQVSANKYQMASVKTDGTLWTWGTNDCGQLGDNTVISRSSPATVSGGGTTWCVVSSGYRSTSAVKTDGTLWTWGENNCGQLGTDSVSLRSSPGTTSGNGTSWCTVSSGRTHTLGIIKVC